MIGQLFTQDFLKTGIADTPVWQGITDAELDVFITDLKTICAPYKVGRNLNEPMTENEILVRVLVQPGWKDTLTQQIASKPLLSEIGKANSKENKLLRTIRGLVGLVIIELNYFFGDQGGDTFDYKSEFKSEKGVTSIRNAVLKAYNKDIHQKKIREFLLPH